MYANHLLSALHGHTEALVLQLFGRQVGAVAGGDVTPIGKWPYRFLKRGFGRLEWLVPDFDLVHFPDVFTVATAKPCVVTVHDLGPFDLPRLFPDVYRDDYNPALPAYRRATEAAVRRGGCFVCVSDATREALLARFDLPEERAVTIRSGVRGPPPEFVRRVRRDPPRFLMVGRVEHRKNLEVVVAALRLIRERGTEAGLDVVGDMSSSEAVTLRRRNAEEAGGNWLRWRGVVDEAKLWHLYSEATAVLYPSWYEGFGFPPLEAVVAGIPAIASDIPVHRETLGSIVPLAPPESAECWADAIEGLLQSASPLPPDAVERLEARGVSWSVCAQRTIDVYRRMAA